jgi:hypothetical protein
VKNVKPHISPANIVRLVRGFLYLLLLSAVICIIPFAMAQSENPSHISRVAAVLGRIRDGAKPQRSIDSTTGMNRPKIVPGRFEDALCQYTITYGSQAIVPGSSDTGNNCTWCDTTINLAFPFALYDQTFNTVMVNSSGRLDFVCNNEPSGYTEACPLPASPNNCPYDYTIFALWGEWSTTPTAPGCSTWTNGCGIFTSISGSAPNRIFNIEWHAVRRENDALTANFEVRLYENDPNKRFDVVYGVIEPYPFSVDLFTAGVQGPTGFFSQDFCNVPAPQNVSTTYAMLPCVTPTPTATPTTIVTNTNDSGPGSLRQALADARNRDIINFDPTLDGRNIGVISAELVIDKSISITGPGSNLLGVYGASQTGLRIFHVMPGVTATIAGLTISGGAGDQKGGGGILNDHATVTIDSCIVQNSFAVELNSGGGIYNDGSGGSATLTILNSTVSENYAYLAGGGIYNDGDGGRATLNITNSTVDGNGAAHNDIPFGGGEGGGIYNNIGTVTITDSVVSNNIAGVPDQFPVGTGGGILNFGTMTITNSTITGNHVYLVGGGIESDGTLTITRSTISGNRADGAHDGQPWGHGGGISGTVNFTNSTLSGNYASLSAGGLEGDGVIMNSTISDNGNGGISTDGLKIGNTILNSNSGATIDGTAISLGYNISSDDAGGNLTGPGDQINTDPMIGSLQDNGGPTLTHALLPGSPAIDAGDPGFTPPPWYDQRGPDFWRLRNDRIDVGAFEVQNGPALTPTPAPTPRPTPTPRSHSTPVPR